MKIITGNLLDMAENQKFDAIVHGCNCFHTMGGGIAGQIADRYPQVPRDDSQNTIYGHPAKLGTYRVVSVNKRYKESPKFAGVESKREVISIPEFTVINAYTQFQPGPDFMQSIFPVLLGRLNKDFAGKHLGFPLIGCGIGGGDWEQVMNELLRYLPDVKVTVVVYG